MLTPKDDMLLQFARAVRATGYGFVTPTPATHARVNARPGTEWAADLADVFGWSRRFRPELLPPGLFDLMRAAEIVAPDGEGWRSLVRLSSLDGTLFLHSAYPTTAADSVFFGPDTYRFARAIRAALAARRSPVHRAVDLGCGAGPGAILVARACPEAEILAVDINDAALRLTAINAELAGVALRPVRSDLLHGVDGTFDLIVANPPYLVDPAQRRYRHGGGAFGAGLSFAIVEAACHRLAPGGTLLLYTGAAILHGADPFRAEVEARLAGSDLAWDYEEVDPDVFGEELAEPAYAAADRIAAVVLTATRPEEPTCPREASSPFVPRGRTTGFISS